MWEVSFVVRPKFKHFPPNFTNFCLPSKSSCLATLVKTLHSEMLNSSKIYFKNVHSGDFLTNLQFWRINQVEASLMKYKYH